MRNKLLTFLLLIYCLAATVRAQIPASPQLVLQVANGGFVSFRSETSAADDQGDQGVKSLPATLSSQAVAGKNQIIHRVVTDSNRQVIFGYDLWIESNPETMQFNLAILPSDRSFRRKFLNDSAAKTMDQTFATFPGSTAKQILSDGDAVSLVLLVNRELGLKLVDVVKVTFDRRKLRDDSLQRAKDFTPDVVAMAVKNHQLLINGNLVAGSRSSACCKGPLLWFYVPGKGRFIFSLVPRDGHDFQKIGLLDENRIEFTANGERYEWFSSAPILPTGGVWNLWVLQDPKYTPLFGADQSMPNEKSGLLQKLGEKVWLKGGWATVTLRGSTEGVNNNESPPVQPRVMIGAADNIKNLLPNASPD